MNITRDLCDYLAGLTADRLDQDLLEDIRYKTLDWLGCVTGALDKKSSRAVLEMARESGGLPSAAPSVCRKRHPCLRRHFPTGCWGTRWSTTM